MSLKSNLVQYLSYTFRVKLGCGNLMHALNLQCSAISFESFLYTQLSGQRHLNPYLIISLSIHIFLQQKYRDTKNVFPDTIA